MVKLYRIVRMRTPGLRSLFLYAICMVFPVLLPVEPVLGGVDDFELSFYWKKSPLGRSGQSTLGALARDSREATGPDGKKARWEGIAWRKLEKMLEVPAEADLVIFQSEDYLTFFLEREKLRKLNPILAVARQGKLFRGDNWPRTKKHGRTWHLGPFALIAEDSVIRKNALTELPFQVHTIRWQQSSSFWRERKLPSGKVGDILRDQCLRCHQVNGAGGNQAPDFLLPEPMSKFLSEKQFVDYIVSPAARGKGSRMFLWNKVNKARARGIYRWIKKSGE